MFLSYSFKCSKYRDLLYATEVVSSFAQPGLVSNLTDSLVHVCILPELLRVCSQATLLAEVLRLSKNCGLHSSTFIFYYCSPFKLYCIYKF